MGRLEIHVGDGLDAAGERFARAWERAEAGEVVGETHLSFESYETLLKILTPKRLQLLRRLHARPAASVAGLARDLGRDYKRVHADVEALAQAGLIEKDQAVGLTAPYDALQTTIAL